MIDPKYNSRAAEYEKVKAKRDRYPYNLLLNTVSGTCGEAQAQNLLIMMAIAERRDMKAVISLAYFRDGLSKREVESKFYCDEEDVTEAIDHTRMEIIKYKDSLFNGFNNSKLCIKLREEFKAAKIPNDMVMDLNKCHIYDIKQFEFMTSEELVKRLSDHLEAKRSGEIIQKIMPLLKDAGYNTDKIFERPKLGGKEKKVTLGNRTRRIRSHTAKIYKIEPVVNVHFRCPICNDSAMITFPVISGDLGIYVDNFDDKEYTCPKCKGTIKLRRNENLL